MKKFDFDRKLKLKINPKKVCVSKGNITLQYIKQEYDEDDKVIDEYYDADESMDIRVEDVESLPETDENNTLPTETRNCEDNPFASGQSAKRKKSNGDKDIILKSLGSLTKHTKDGRERLQDECSIFGELVTHKLRKLDEKSRTIAEHKIQNIFYELKMARFNVDQSSSSSQPTYQFYLNNHVPVSDTMVSDNNLTVNSESANRNRSN